MKNLLLSLIALSSVSAFADNQALQEWINSLVAGSQVTPITANAVETQEETTQENAEETAEVAQCVDADGNDIWDDPEKFSKLISESETCAEATQLAEGCARGSSMDVYTVSLANEVCEAERADKGADTPEITTVLDSMKTACLNKYKNQDGSMYRSMEAYCALSAINWVVDHLGADE